LYATHDIKSAKPQYQILPPLSRRTPPLVVIFIPARFGSTFVSTSPSSSDCLERRHAKASDDFFSSSQFSAKHHFFFLPFVIELFLLQGTSGAPFSSPTCLAGVSLFFPITPGSESTALPFSDHPNFTFPFSDGFHNGLSHFFRRSNSERPFRPPPSAILNFLNFPPLPEAERGYQRNRARPPFPPPFTRRCPPPFLS